MTAPTPTAHHAVDAYTAAQEAQDAAVGHSARTFRIWRGADGQGEFRDYTADETDRGQAKRQVLSLGEANRLERLAHAGSRSMPPLEADLDQCARRRR